MMRSTTQAAWKLRRNNSVATQKQLSIQYPVRSTKKLFSTLHLPFVVFKKIEKYTQQFYLYLNYLAFSSILGGTTADIHTQDKQIWKKSLGIHLTCTAHIQHLVFCFFGTSFLLILFCQWEVLESSTSLCWTANIIFLVRQTTSGDSRLFLRCPTG